MSHPAPTAAHITTWDRIAIVALGGAGCALSYDALQQMATAIHVRGILTFVFPLVIDGFIAYGVRALLVLRTASLAARYYVWLLFGTATGASIWANALHAVRLNQQRPEGASLRLGDVTVGILSTLAPLALAGAVHLYILIARRVTETELSAAPDHVTVRTERVTADRPDSVPTPVTVTGGHRAADADRLAVTQGSDTDPATDTETPVATDKASGRLQDTQAEPESDRHDRAVGLGGHSDTRPRPVTVPHPAKPLVTVLGTGRTNGPDARDHKGTTVTDEDLLDIARPAVDAAGRLTRSVVAKAIRDRNLGLGNDRLTDLMRLLREEAEQQTNAQTG
ncbi:DUF2637 domain-containing protein [Streptomyces sp. NPDC058067]|uniref:DUF2637 domain-containing protein n=1 Tax=Streptomyces sp. NPDC058067 TaxID=3346324 RepID=UPI0036E9B550